MSEPLLNVLKLVLLVLLYLFFFRVIRAVWVEVKTPPAAGGAPRRRRPRRAGRAARKPPRRLVALEPAEVAGQEWTVGAEISLGRAAGCAICVDDTFVSQIHARVFERDGQIMVEDLGSTNGTYLNRRRISGPVAIQRGDLLQVGNTILELR